MSFNLPHRANVGEIIRVRGYEANLYLVQEHLEEISHDGTGSEPCVTYTCVNIDNYKEIKIVFDEDVLSIAVTADKSDAFLKRRQGNAQPPALQKEERKTDISNLQIDIHALLKHFQEARDKKLAEGGGQAKTTKQPRSPHEEARKKMAEDKEYLDYLLDVHSMLKDLETLLGPDSTRQEEMRLIEEEFREKSIALYGRHSS